VRNEQTTSAEVVGGAADADFLDSGLFLAHELSVGELRSDR
jgi:hypothetical protein